MDDVINRLEISELGCNINGIYLECLLYADDIILLSESVTAMQTMLDICGQFANEMYIKFNANKSVAMRIGSRYKVQCSLLQLSGRDLIYVNKIKYLGVYITASSKFMCNYDHCKLNFLNQNLFVWLLKAYCLPVIMCSLEATWPFKTVTNMLDNLITLAVKRNFQLRDYDLVDNIRQYVGLNNITQSCNVQKLKLMKRFSDSSMV